MQCPTSYSLIMIFRSTSLCFFYSFVRAIIHSARASDTRNLISCRHVCLSSVSALLSKRSGNHRILKWAEHTLMCAFARVRGGRTLGSLVIKRTIRWNRNFIGKGNMARSGLKKQARNFTTTNVSYTSEFMLKRDSLPVTVYCLRARSTSYVN